MEYTTLVQNVERYITLNESAIHSTNTILEMLKEKKFLIHKQNIALKRMKRAIEKGDRNEIGASWLEAKRWGTKARAYKLDDQEYTTTDPPTT